MPECLDIDTFLDRSRARPVLDVRTPAEFAQGHIPGAHNLPLFSNEERAEIGTLYKQTGRRSAMLRGLDLVGPRMRAMVEQAAAWTEGTEVLVHCWRGGMRSGSVASLLEFFGYRVATLDGGYKAFRRHVLAGVYEPRRIHLLGGMTGSGKTGVLHALARQGEQVIDLEGLAHHKGSVFGHLGEPEQPSQEHFENELAVQWLRLDRERPVWLEDESRRIGRIVLPGALWTQMLKADLYVLDVSFEARVQRLLAGYGHHAPERLIEAITCIGKRLGGLRTRQATEAVRAGDLEGACRLLLAYYDQAYRYHQERDARVVRHAVSAHTSEDPVHLAARLRALTARCAGASRVGVN